MGTRLKVSDQSDCFHFSLSVARLLMTGERGTGQFAGRSRVSLINLDLANNVNARPSATL